MGELVTRDGKVLKGPGTWEQEQLKKMKDIVAPPKPKQIHNGKGRKPFDTAKRPMLFITRLFDTDEKRAHWVVKPVVDGVKQPTRTFVDCKLGGKEKAKELAIQFRDEFIKNQLEKKDAGTM